MSVEKEFLQDNVRHTEATDNQDGGFFGVSHFECERKKRSPRRFRRMKGGGEGEGREKGGGRTKWAKGNN